MKSEEVIARYEQQRDRDDIVDMYGKDAYYDTTRHSKRSYKCRSQRQRTSTEQQEEARRREAREHLQRAVEKRTAVKAEREITDSWEDVMDNELESSKVCHICLEDYEDFHPRLRLPCCGHEYHVECLNGLAVQEVRLQSKQFPDINMIVLTKKCPNCRSKFSMP